MKESFIQPDAPTGSKLGDKNDVAAMMGVCHRSVSNLMQRGMPHLKIGRRKVRFDMTEVSAWLKREYGTSRLGKEDGK